MCFAHIDFCFQLSSLLQEGLGVLKDRITASFYSAVIPGEGPATPIASI
ncbi:MAG TPA: hypothetical protein VK213_09065 [Bacteroidales bacterium]|nr:hypothetical protein [Bacteroidales bacterium]